MIDFLNNHDGLCKDTSLGRFWIHDDELHPYAYLEVSPCNRGCEVLNGAMKCLVFRPIDKALYSSADHCRCDALLRTSSMDQFYFVELKDWIASGWYKHGIEQLEATIEDFRQAHPGILEAAKYRSAYVVNIRKHKFVRTHIETMRNFVRKHHVLLRETQPIEIR